MTDAASTTLTPESQQGGAICERCGCPLEPFRLDMPFGLGARTFHGECACVTARREQDARERERQSQAERVRRLLGQSGIGPRHQAASFDNFTATSTSRPVVEVCRAFVTGFPTNGAGLTLGGPAGTGKTHLAAAVTRALIDRGHSAVLVNVPWFLLTARGTFAENNRLSFDDVLELITTCAHLTLDDLGRERQTDWVQETLYMIVDARYQRCRATSVTTNLPLNALRQRVGEPILDRLAETNQAYWCQWPSYRRRGEPWAR